MKVNPVVRKSRIAAPIAAGFLAAVAAFAPTRVDSLQLDFWVFLVRQLKFEIGFLFILGVLFILPKSVYGQIASSLRRYLPRFKGRPDEDKIVFTIISLLVGVLSCFCLFMIFLVSLHLAYNRAFFYKNLIYSAHRQDLYIEGLKNERANKPDQAINYYRRIIDSYPKDHRNYLIQRRVNKIEAKLRYATSCVERSLDEERTRGINRQSFALIVEGVHLDPTNELVRSELRSHIDKLEVGKDSPIAFHNALTSGDKSSASEILKRWGWYLFEDELTGGAITSTPGQTEKNDALTRYEFLKRFSAEDFKIAVERSWHLNSAVEVMKRSKE